MTKQKYAAATLLGLLFTAGTILTAGTASAATGGQRITTATTTAAAGVPERPKCYWVRGHWRWDYRRGERVWVPRHRVCR